MRYLLALCALAMSCTVGDPTDDSRAGEDLTDADKASSEGVQPGMLARVCASGTTTPGVDVSYYNTSIDWTAVKNAGIQFAIARVSDGLHFPDPKFSAYYGGAKAAGLVRGAYQLFRPNQSASSQADMMIAAVGTLGPGDLPPIIDVEKTGGLGPSTIAVGIQTWVDRVKAATGVQPIVYTGKYFWRDQVGGSTTFANNPLWIAAYTSLCPDLPLPWGSWAFWQYYDKARVGGIAGDTDVDRFNGSLEELQALAGGMPSGTSTTCTSQTMAADEPDGTCVQSAADQSWYACEQGSWVAVSSTASCTATLGWCDSATLGRAVPPRSCVQSASDSTWYQCDGSHWATPVDPTADTGPAGACAHSYPL